MHFLLANHLNKIKTEARNAYQIYTQSIATNIKPLKIKIFTYFASNETDEFKLKKPNFPDQIAVPNP